MPREAVEAQAPSFAVQPVGSGPFMIRSRTDDLIHLVPAPGVEHAAAGRRLPGPARRRRLLRRLPRRAAGLDGGAGRPGRAGGRAPTGRVGFRPYLGELFYGFNLKNPKFADIRFREAIVRAIDRDAIVRAIYGAARPAARRAGARRRPGLPAGGVRGPVRATTRSGPGPWWREAFGGEPVPEVAIDFDDAGTQRAVAEAMQANLQAVGIPAALRSHPFADYLKFAVSGQQEIFRLGWIGPYPTADAFLTPLFLSGLADNVTGFSSDPVDELLQERPGRGRRGQAHRQLPAGREAGAGAAARHPPGPVPVPLAGERPGERPGDVRPGHLRRHKVRSASSGRDEGGSRWHPRRSGGIGRRARLRAWCPHRA